MRDCRPFKPIVKHGAMPCVKRWPTPFKLALDDIWQAVLEQAGGNAQAVGRTHIAKVMADKGLVSDVQKAFTGYLARCTNPVMWHSMA